jgi:hypothetical protein
MTLVLTIFVVVAVLVLALALAWLPMRLLLGQLARNVSQFIQRQRERRQAGRETPDRRKTPQTR